MIQFDNLDSAGPVQRAGQRRAGRQVAGHHRPLLRRPDASPNRLRALEPSSTAPVAGDAFGHSAETMGFLAQALAFEQVKEYRFMLSPQDG